MTRTTERYMHLGDKPAIEAVEMVSMFLAAALAGKPMPSANEGKAPESQSVSGGRGTLRPPLSIQH